MNIYWKALFASVVTFTTDVSAQPLKAAPIVTTTSLPLRAHVTYAFALIDPRQYIISVKSFDRPFAITSIPTNIACNGLAITGGFSKQVNSRLSPEGLVRTASGQVSDLANWADGGILSIELNRTRVTRIASWRNAPIATGMALQSRPILVFNGKVDYPLRITPRWNRVAIGTMSDGSTAFIGAFNAHGNALTMQQFAEDAKSLLGDRLVTLLNMDGGPSAFLYSSQTRILPAQGAVTTYVCAEHR